MDTCLSEKGWGGLRIVVCLLAAQASMAQSRFSYTYSHPAVENGLDEAGRAWNVAYDAGTQQLAASYYHGDVIRNVDYQLPVRFQAFITGTAAEVAPGTWRYQYEVSNAVSSAQGLQGIIVEIGDDVFDIEAPSVFEPTLNGELPRVLPNRWGFALGKGYVWMAVDGAGVPVGASRILAFKSHPPSGTLRRCASTAAKATSAPRPASTQRPARMRVAGLLTVQAQFFLAAHRGTFTNEDWAESDPQCSPWFS